MNSIIHNIHNCEDLQYLLEYLCISKENLSIDKPLQQLYENLYYKDIQLKDMIHQYIQSIGPNLKGTSSKNVIVDTTIKKISDTILWSLNSFHMLSDEVLFEFYIRLTNYLKELELNYSYYEHIKTLFETERNESNIQSYFKKTSSLNISFMYNIYLLKAIRENYSSLISFICKHATFINPYSKSYPIKYREEFTKLLIDIIQESSQDVKHNRHVKFIYVLETLDRYITLPIEYHQQIEVLIHQTKQMESVMISNQELSTFIQNMKNTEMTLAQRDIIRLFLYKTFDSSFDEIKECFTDDKFIFLHTFLVEKVLSSSLNVMADIYKICYPLTNVPIDISQKEKWLSYCSTNPSLHFILKLQPKQDSYNEEYFLCLLSKMVREHICLNFPAFYRRFSCNDCKSERVHIHKNCEIILSEYINGGTLRSFFINLLNEKNEHILSIITSICMQIIFAIYVLSINGIYHNDLHWNNILIKKIKPGGHFEYKINDKSYFIPNYGYVAIVWDFGYSIHFNLNSKHRYFGNSKLHHNVSMKEPTSTMLFLYSLNFLLRDIGYWLYQESMTLKHLHEILHKDEDITELVSKLYEHMNIFNRLFPAIKTVATNKRISIDELMRIYSSLKKEMKSELFQEPLPKPTSPILLFLNKLNQIFTTIIPRRSILPDFINKPIETFVSDFYTICKQPEWDISSNLIYQNSCKVLNPSTIQSCLTTYLKK